MALTTLRNSLNDCNPNNALDHLRRLYDSTLDVGFGDIIAAMRPRAPRVRSSLTNQAAHVHDVACWVVDVYVTAGTPLAKVYGAAPDAGEVRIEYDATTGVPTFTFNAATTTYATVEMGPLPQNIATVMALSTGG